jgi:Ca-activated chloride channel family protein
MDLARDSGRRQLSLHGDRGAAVMGLSAMAGMPAMIELAGVSLLRPFWVLVLPLLVVVGVLALKRAARPGDWQSRIQPEMLTALTALGRVETARTTGKTVLPLVIAGLVVLALTGPAVEKRRAQTFRNLYGVVFVIYVSGSMTRDASWTSMVTMARAGVSVLGSRPAALVVYAGDSYLASPLTTDHVQLGQTMSLLDDKTVPDRGNRPGLALQRAAQILTQAEIMAGNVVLMTDGAGLGPDTALAARAVRDITARGARLWVVQAATSVSGEVDPTRPEALRRLADLGAGQLYTQDQVADFMADLKAADAQHLQRQDLQLLLLTDVGRYLLLFALLPALLFFRKERV